MSDALARAATMQWQATPVSPPFVAPLWGDLFSGVLFWGAASPNESNNR